LFSIFNRLVRPHDGVRAGASWSLDGVEWSHTRHAFRCAEYQFSIDAYIGHRRGKGGWRLMVLCEGWWAAGKDDPFKNSQTAHLLSGDRAAALAWFRRQDEASR
jgi:hypothetical protein